MRWKTLGRDATLAVGAGVAVRAGVAVARKRKEALQEKEIRSRLNDILEGTDWTDDDLKYVLEHLSDDEDRLAFTEKVHEYLRDDESRILNIDENMGFHLIRNFPTMHVLITLLEHEKISIINRALREIYFLPEVIWNDWFVKETLRSLSLLLDSTLAIDKDETRFVLLKVFRSNRFRRMKDTDKEVKKYFEQLIQKLKLKDDVTEKVFLDRIYTLHPPDDKVYKIERIRRILNQTDIGAEDVNFALEHFFETPLASEERGRLEAMVRKYLSTNTMYENEINLLWIKTKVKMLEEFPTIIANYDFLNDKNRIVSEAALSAIKAYPEEQLSKEVVLKFVRWLQKLLKYYEAHDKEHDGLHNSAEILLDELRKSDTYKDITLKTLWENRLKIDGFPYRF